MEPLPVSLKSGATVEPGPVANIDTDQKIFTSVGVSVFIVSELDGGIRLAVAKMGTIGIVPARKVSIPGVEPPTWGVLFAQDIFKSGIVMKLEGDSHETSAG